MKDLKAKMIIIADDNQTFLIYMCMLLKRLGFTVLPAENGLEVLKLMKFCEPDVIILDINMSGMDGITLLRYIKEDRLTSRVPVIMVSSDSSNELIRKCKKLGCAGFLTKPVKISKLHDVLEKCVFSQIRKKRKHLRVSLNKRVVVIYNGIHHILYTETISEKGVYIRKTDSFPIGSEVEVVFPLEDERTIRLKGKVIHVKGLFGDVFNVPPGMGIEFNEISNEHSRLLKDYIEKFIAKDIIESQEETVIELSCHDRKGKRK